MAGNPPGWSQRPPAQVPLSKGSGKARVVLKPEQFDALITDQGVRVRVYRTILCPNVKSIDGAEHDIDCNVCKGSGFYDAIPLETRAFIQSQTLTKAGQPEGYVDQCSGVATFLSGVTLQYFTLIEALDYQDTFFERVKRQRGDLDILKYKAICVNLLVDQNGKTYASGNDFDLDQNGNIAWKLGRAPEAGTIYSLHYTMALQFRAIRAMHVNRFAQTVLKGNALMVKMPEQWAIEKVYLADRKDSQCRRLEPNLIRDEDPSDS